MKVKVIFYSYLYCVIVLPLSLSLARNLRKDAEEKESNRRGKVSNICISSSQSDRDPSVVSSSTDDGGFNEPSPEIKAKLKPPYQFDVNSPPLPPSPPARSTTTITTLDNSTIIAGNNNNKNVPPPLPQSPPDVSSSSDDDKPSTSITHHTATADDDDDGDNNQPDLTYVDIVHDTKIATVNGCNGYENIAVDRQPLINQHQSVLYSTIKPEIPPPMDYLFETETKDEAKLLDIDDPTNAAATTMVRESSFIPMADGYDVGDDDPAEKPLPAVPVESKLNPVPEAGSEQENEEDDDVEEIDIKEVEKDRGGITAPDPMTVEEADKLLSSR